MKKSSCWKQAGGGVPVVGTFRAAVAGLVLAGLFCLPPGAGATTYYVASSGSDANAGTSWALPKQTIQAAVDLTISNDVVLVSNGVYSTGGRVVYGTLMTNRVAISNAITVQSVNGPALTKIVGQGPLGTGAVRCVYVGTNAVLSGFTLTNGFTLASGDSYNERSGGGAFCADSAIMSNCVIAGNAAANFGGGVFSGTNYNCTLSGNSVGGAGGATVFTVLIGCVVSNNTSAASGGAMRLGSAINSLITGNSAATFGGATDTANLTNCVVSANTAGSNGGGIYAGTVRNCAIFGNSAGGLGGGIYSPGGRIINCTVTGNSAVDGGGTYGGFVNNCIVYYNQSQAAVSGINCSGSVVSNSCAYPIQSGTGNITNEPALASPSHIVTNSPCRGAGLAGSALGTDIDGDAWASPPSMGCDEPTAGALTGALIVTPWVSLTNITAGFTVSFRAYIDGRLTRSTWNFADGTMMTNRAYVQHAFTSNGVFAVTLTAYNDSFPGGVSGSVNVAVSSQVVHYVRIGNPSPVSPYTSWATAATNIQHAIDAATQIGALVLVSNGTYATGGRAIYGSMTNRVVVDKIVTVRSVNGPAATTIAGAGPVGDAAVRCVYVANNAMLSGFALTNGYTGTNGDTARVRSGGGAWCEYLGAISNCVFNGNVADQRGGGVEYGYVYNCVFSNNTAYLGGGASDAFVYDSRFVQNLAGSGGGAAYLGSLSRCTCSGNTATNNGGAVYGGTHYNCVLSYNASGFRGGGAQGAALGGCALYGNWSADSGGGTYDCGLTNCTVIWNTALSAGGGTYNSGVMTNVNCIVYYNRCNGTTPNWRGSGGSYVNSCTTPMPPGYSNILAEPLMASFTHLSGLSPCKHAGDSSKVAGVDIDGDAWTIPPAMGCDDLAFGAVTGAVSAAIRASATNVAVGSPIEFQADISGRLTNSVWNFGDGTVVTNQPMQTHSFGAIGAYPVVLAGFNETFPAGVSATVMIQVAVQTIHYVSISNATPAAPFTSWATAATNIQDAINVATQPGALVLVTNGNYNTGGTNMYGLLINRVVLNKPLTIRSVNGPQQTFITGKSPYGASAVRCAYVGTNATLSGFTLASGGSSDTGNYYLEDTGGGVWSEFSGLVTNCILFTNTAATGAGCFGGTLRNCTLVNNASYADGAGALNSTLYSCTVISNFVTVSGYSGGGVAGCVIYDSLLSWNKTASPSGSGGGAYNSVLFNCTIRTNTAPGGGGASGCWLTNCIVERNSASTSVGGGLGGGTAYNCTITSNVAVSGGGASGTTLYQCDIRDNRATTQGGGLNAATGSYCTVINNTSPGGNGGGASGGRLNNSILFGNTSANGGGAYDTELHNCTVARNTATTEAGGLYCTSFGLRDVYNSIIISNSAPTTNLNWYSATFFNLIYSSCTVPSPGFGSITNNPQFVSLATTNLRLLATSPCINTGDNVQATGSVDLDGNPRISGGTVDMGAYEFQSGVPDADGDGIPDWWETLYYGGATNAVPTALASNGINTVLDAWIADLNPTNPASVFRIASASNTPAGTLALVIGPASTARVYRLFTTTNLLANPQDWPFTGSIQTGNGSTIIFTVTNGTPQQNNRTSVQLP